MPRTDVLAAYTTESFEHAGRRHDVHHRGVGPPVIVVAEIPGVTPRVVEFADRLVDAGMAVAVPSMFGTDGAPSTMPRAMAMFARTCVSREFISLATRDVGPATEWLRALARRLRDEAGQGVGFVGMCFTGGYGLAMMLDDAVVAPVLSQPSMPLPIGKNRKANFGLDDAEMARVAERAADGCPVLGLRFTNDSLVPPDRFERLRELLGDNFRGIEITSPDKARGIASTAHSVLTEDLVDEPGHPTRDALDETIRFLADRLGVPAR